MVRFPSLSNLKLKGRKAEKQFHLNKSTVLNFKIIRYLADTAIFPPQILISFLQYEADMQLINLQI